MGGLQICFEKKSLRAIMETNASGSLKRSPYNEEEYDVGRDQSDRLRGNVRACERKHWSSSGVAEMNNLNLFLEI
jgi:hypothetical protein